MKTPKTYWDLLILDAAPPVKDLGSLATGDIDGDGHIEVIVGGNGALLWYRPDTFEKGHISASHFGVGLTLEDIDGDGKAAANCAFTKKPPPKAKPGAVRVRHPF